MIKQLFYKNTNNSGNVYYFVNACVSWPEGWRDVEGGSVEGSFDCWLIAVPD